MGKLMVWNLGLELCMEKQVSEDRGTSSSYALSSYYHDDNE